ncbi:large ribosomal subunit protein uL1m isoform X2 [Heteronotia binoei]|uniref:large ribosomal subunit protein uL1m isoform X2 n=1 Tax=Heteronotia binoei TaxID=13085 RepID=UPI0029300C3A|nr:large ribosomal subunit protein uL1m isoform X2 [Heteronotia binoei]XP_060103128.1 large ribosomal subunit protein uL1m isoform X2 [Heteronotia binoei]
MAAPMVRCCLRAVSIQYPSSIFTRIGKQSVVVPAFANVLISNRFYASKKESSKKKSKKKTAVPEPLYKKKRYVPELLSGPTDDVYLTWCYQRPIYEIEVAVDMLKKFQELDFTSPGQAVYGDITLDMSMDKKKPVEPFAATLLLPYQFEGVVNKVLVFTENADEAALAKEHGAAFVGAFELFKPILDGEIQADYYVTVPAMVTKLNSLRGVLKDKHPKSKNGSVSYDIPRMLNFFKGCREYRVEKENRISMWIAKLNMPNDQIVANLDAVIKDVCKHKPLSYGPFVKRLIIRSASSEGLDLKFERFLPAEALKGKAEEKAEGEAEDSDEEEEMRGSK